MNQRISASDNLPSFWSLNDRWIFSSAMQKAIRRGDVGIAQQAAHALHRLDKSMLWRRLAVLALEDIAPLDLHLLLEALAPSKTPDLSALVARLCLTAKDRSGDYLLSIVQHSPDYARYREQWTCEQPDSGRPTAIATGPELEARALRAWHSAGTDVAPVDALPRRRGNPASVFESFRQRGIPAVLVDACERALPRLRNPLPLFTPLIWEVLQNAKFKALVPPVPMVATPLASTALYALGGHTRLGKRAMRAWVRSDRKIALVLARLAVPTKCWCEAVELAVFHVESAVVVPSLVWDTRERSPTEKYNVDADISLDEPGQWDLGGYFRERAIQADFHAIGFPIRAIPTFLECVAQGLPQLDQVRTAVIEREIAARANGRQASWKF